MKISGYLPSGPQVTKEVIAVVIGSLFTYYMIPIITAYIAKQRGTQ